MSPKKGHPAHKPKRILRTLIASMKNTQEFGKQMHREATRRKFDQADRKAFVADGLTCNWRIHAEHFADYVPILDFTHAVSYPFYYRSLLSREDSQGQEKKKGRRRG